ncbi:MAG TPA: DUF4058 family protein [Gemmataceae bacterium]|nr:DUF4058 family protein [Gemmataceae bacterium]
MPLLDHFHSPLYPLHRWESFHNRWVNAIADALDRALPSRFFAEVQTHLGAQIEADVAEFEKTPLDPGEEHSPDGTAGGVAIHAYAPPVATMVMPAFYPDDFEVQIRDASDDARLVAVVELVSPRNKDRPAARRAFAAKSAAYLQRGVGVIAVDTITTRQANMHDELVQLMDLEDNFKMPAEASMAAVAYRPARRSEANEIDVWAVALAVGGTLPVLPLALLRHGPIPLDLEATYTEARQRARL